jgi:hypothetical protein
MASIAVAVYSDTPQNTPKHPTPSLILFVTKCGRSANKFRKSQIRELADLDNFLDLLTFRQCDPLWTCDLRTQLFVICGLKTSASPQMHLFLLKNIALCSN